MRHTIFLHRIGAAAVLALALLLAACGGAAAVQLIGSVSREAGGGAPAPTRAEPGADLLVVYSAYLELEVRDVSRAAERAAQLAYDAGGYLAESQVWRRSGRAYATVTLAVPVANYDWVYAGLLDLGTVASERVSGEPRPLGRYRDEWNTFTHITVSLQPAEGPLRPERPAPDERWSPARTFRQAAGFVAGIWQALADGLIWLVVVAGPFALVGLGLWAVLRRWRRPRVL